jgi:hypothetical protein
MRRYHRLFSWILLILTSVGALGAAPWDRQEWLELRTEHFAILYQVDDYPLAFALQNDKGPILDRLFVDFNALFRVQLDGPLTIRIYPDISAYETLNAVAPPVLEDATHSRIGRREIALFAGNIFNQPNRWDQESMNALYYELAILFAIEASQNQAPTGLLVSLGAYARNPMLVAKDGLADLEVAGLDWLGIWEDDALRLSPERTVLGASMAAYLIDAAGWDHFVSFLKILPDLESLPDALAAQYGQMMSDFEARWAEYWPYYLKERWAVNFFHAYDLARYETLISAGAYQDAAIGLSQAVQHLAHLDQPENLEEARRLLSLAEQGQSAGDALLSSRQSVLEGQYEQALVQLGQAEALFLPLGGTSRQEEIDALRAHIESVLALRAEVDALEEDRPGLLESYGPGIARLEAIGNALGALGDAGGQAKADALREAFLSARRSRQWILAGAGFLVMMGLVALFFIVNRRQRQPEGDL